MRYLLLCVLTILSVSFFTACDTKSNEGGETLTIRLSGIPDADKAKLSKQYAVVCEFLSEELGQKVEYVHVPDYSGAVSALAGNKIDVAWLGGVTSVRAEEQCEGKVTFLTCRESDLKFKSYFIAHKDAIAKHGLTSGQDLKGLAAQLKNCSFTFGSKSSTSGHIMPRHFLAESGLSADDCFAGKPKYQLKGGHSATLKDVSSGIVEAGALSYKTWENADAETKANAPVVYETPTYVDYCILAHSRLGDELIGKLQKAFTQLDPKNEKHAAVLEVFSAKKFVAAKKENWDGIRAVLKELDENKSS